jgi:uncharacterized Zn finger protein
VCFCDEKSRKNFKPKRFTRSGRDFNDLARTLNLRPELLDEAAGRWPPTPTSLRRQKVQKKIGRKTADKVRDANGQKATAALHGVSDEFANLRVTHPMVSLSALASTTVL